jgi:hypothetical protein
MQDDERDINRHLQMRRKPIRLRTNRADSCGFMVGLMIVSSLFGVIWWPIYLAARPKAQGATCLSHIKQLSNAISLYAQDWDECRPSAEHWGDSLPRYLGSAFEAAGSEAPDDLALEGVGIQPAPAIIVVLAGCQTDGRAGGRAAHC